MSEDERNRWDRRWAEREPSEPRPPEAAKGNLDLLPVSGRALDVACGQGAQAVWLALRGLEVVAVDISPRALAAARALAERHGVADRVTFREHDLDTGPPPLAHDLDTGPPPENPDLDTDPPPLAHDLDLVVCQRFLHRGFLSELTDRLKPGGLAAVSVLSDVGAPASAVGSVHRVRPGELAGLLAGLEILDSGEGDGVAWALARRP
ncbi:MAG TPA: class I SAM-dependent methyltransferase [Acidimicrobiales bacterium]|nr:class I SAM-dependent methyltransferase [Acidimicrobiales bacterium]